MANRTRHRTEAELKALFEQAVRAIGFYEAQRKEVLMALESLRRALNARRPKPPTPKRARGCILRPRLAGGTTP
jgi:hypothetical protein